MSGQIFISYRREDSSAWAGRLSDRLRSHFPSNHIFMDVDAIDPGVDFIEAVEEVVSACDVLIAVIGSRWMTASDRGGRRRLDIPEDIVRLEIATALKRGIRVIPVLVEGATMPEVAELPDDLKTLVRRNALEIGHIRFNADSEHLVSAVERALGKATEERERQEKERLQTERRKREENERPEAERRETKAKEPLEAKQLTSVAAPSTHAAKSEPDKPSAETPKVVSPLLPKPVESEREKPPPSSSGGSGGKSPTKRGIGILAIATVLLVGGLLIYQDIRTPRSPPPQPAKVAAVTPTPPVSATPTVEEKAPTTPEVAVQASTQPTAPVAVAIPSPSISATPTKEDLTRTALDNATKERPWVNSLWMRFVPVARTQVLFSIWDTRVQDFEAFVADTNYNATRGMWSLVSHCT
jgi:TIR domain-containing protein